MLLLRNHVFHSLFSHITKNEAAIKMDEYVVNQVYVTHKAETDEQKKELYQALENEGYKIQQEFVGVGFTGGDEPEYNDGAIHIAKFGKDILIGDKIIIMSLKHILKIILAKYRIEKR